MHWRTSLKYLYGPASALSEYQSGDRIRYLEKGWVCSGIIQRICAPRMLRDHSWGMMYLVRPQHGGWFARVFPTNIRMLPEEGLE